MKEISAIKQKNALCKRFSKKLLGSANWAPQPQLNYCTLELQAGMYAFSSMAGTHFLLLS
jgi:hypothetical protein